MAFFSNSLAQVPNSNVFPLRLPYVANDLPSLLPTSEEIHNPRNKHFAVRIPGRAIVLVKEIFVVKYGRSVNLGEADNLAYLEMCKPAVRFPRLYAAYRDEVRGENVLVMEHIPSKSLKELWPSLSADMKLSVERQLGHVISEFRRMKTPLYFGRLGQQPYRDELFFLSEFVDRLAPGATFGPFITEHQIRTAILDVYSAIRGDDYPERLVMYRDDLMRTQGQNTPYFTHGDLQRKNILLTPQGEVAIIDFELAGFYPIYWEGVAVRIQHYFDGVEDDWTLASYRAFGKDCSEEYHLLMPLCKDIWEAPVRRRLQTIAPATQDPDVAMVYSPEMSEADDEMCELDLSTDRFLTQLAAPVDEMCELTLSNQKFPDQSAGLNDMCELALSDEMCELALSREMFH